MEPDEISLLLEQVIARLESIELELDRLSVDVGQVQAQGVEIGEEIESVKRAVEAIDPIL